jgi:opacity protein-like surface antigen
MKKHIMFFIFTIALLGITYQASALEASASEINPNYSAIKLGIYSPSNSYDLSNFNGGHKTHLDSKTGFDGEIAFGHYFLPVFAMEMGAGYFESKGSPAAEPGHLKLKVVPITATAKALLPLGGFEPYGEFGIGAYFTKFDLDGNLGSLSNDSKITYGLHAGAGMNFNLSDAMFLGFEGRYIWTKPSFGGQAIKLGGFTSTAVIGFRF